MRALLGLKQQGQTSMEYLLVVVVAAGLGMTFLKKMDDYLLTNPDSYINGYLNSFNQILKTDPRYKQFPMPK